ncbi:MAG TPA: flagellar hook assembly protein FlgD [Polyangia bacterium]|jgi:Flagellar hook capping protein|nr:flagellar hook assembly protein FlgD [Polyangia bacterium]
MSIETSTIASAGQATQQPAKAQGSDKLGKNEFLKILTAQLANQDPTKPMDSNAFVAQLAQFSALEQAQNTNDTLAQMLTLQQSTGQTGNASVAVAAVGKEATYNASQMTLSTGGSIGVNAILPASAADVIMEVDDANGNVVRSQSFGSKTAGSYNLTWDGCNEAGVAQLPGTYSVHVSAVDLAGKPVSVTQQSRGLITGVSFQNGITQLMIGNTSVSLSDVISIQQASNSQ